MSKTVLIDSSGIFVPTVKVVQRLRMEKANTKSDNFIMPPRAMYFSSLLSCMKKIGIDKDDIVIMAGEGHSFRKDLHSEYKAQREGLRDKDTFVDWAYEFKQLNDLHRMLDESTNWYFIRVAEGLEADDVIAISTRFFSDKECIVVTGDKDLHMLAHYENVKIFNINMKCKGSKGMYEKVKDPLKILAKKADRGDAADNIIPLPSDTKEDFELRYVLVNLLELPDEIEEKGINAIAYAIAYPKELHLDKLPPFKNIEENFLKIYSKERVVTEEYCHALIEKRENVKKKKAKLKKEEKKKNESK